MSEQPEIQSLRKFCKDMGISDTTAWRMRRAGMIRTINISGKQYISREVILEFKRRAEAGEFSKQLPIPKP